MLLKEASTINLFLKNLNFQHSPSVLVTSQHDKWQNRVHHIRLELSNQTDCEQFLLKELQEKLEDVTKLAETLHSFPLVVQQGVCYMKTNNMKINKYLEYFNSNNKKLLGINIKEYEVTEYDKTLFTVWKIAFEKIQENKLALQVIGMIAYMDHRFINKNTFLNLDGINGDEVALNEVVEVLCEYCMISKTQTNYITTHPLVQKMLTIAHENFEGYEQLKRLLLSEIRKDVANIEIATDAENLWFPHVVKLSFDQKDEDMLK